MRRLPLFVAAVSLLGAAAPAPAPAPATAPAAALTKSRVSVLYFDDQSLSPELAVLRKGLTAMLITDLAAPGTFDVVERARLQEVLEELDLGQTKRIDPATAAKVGKLLGVSHQVMGTYIEMPGGRIQLEARVVFIETSKTVRTARAVGKKEDFSDMEQKIANDFSAFLSSVVLPAGTAPAKTGAAVPAADPAKPKAAPPKLAVQTVVKYSKALDAIDRKDKETAKKELQEVVKEQPDFKLAANELAALML